MQRGSAAPLEQLQAVLTTLANAGLRLDPALPTKLQRLHGQCIEINCTMPRSSLHIVIDNGEIALHNGTAERPTVAIYADAPNLLRALLAADQNADLQIDGDGTALLELQHILRNLSLDLTIPLDKALGFNSSQQIASIWELGSEVISQAAKRLQQNMASSSRAAVATRFATTQATVAVQQRIDDLRLRVDRLAARIVLQEQRSQHDNAKDG